MVADEHPPRGPKGDKGDQGTLPRGARRSLLARDAVIIVLLALNFLFTAHYVNTSRASLQSQEQQFQAAEKHQQEQGAKTGASELKALCFDVGSMSLIPPPAGNPATNPSRAYEQAEHRTWQGLYTSIRCKASE